MTHFTPEASDFKVKSQNNLPKKKLGVKIQFSSFQTGQTGWQNLNMHNTSSQRNIRVPHSILSKSTRVQNPPGKILHFRYLLICF